MALSCHDWPLPASSLSEGRSTRSPEAVHFPPLPAEAGLPPLAAEAGFPPLVEVGGFMPLLEVDWFPPCCRPEVPKVEAPVWADLRAGHPLGWPMGPSGTGCPWRHGQVLNWPSSDSFQW